MVRMARGVRQRHHTAKRYAEDDRIHDAERVAERAYVVAPLRQVPAFPPTILASAIASMIQVDNLSDVRQDRVGGLVDRMVEAGATMKHEQFGPFPHSGPVLHQLRTLHIYKQHQP